MTTIPAVLTSCPVWVDTQRANKHIEEWEGIKITTLPEASAKLLLTLLMLKKNDYLLIDTSCLKAFSSYASRDKLNKLLADVSEFYFENNGEKYHLLKDIEHLRRAVKITFNKEFFLKSIEFFGNDTEINEKIFFYLKGKEIRLYLYIISRKEKAFTVDYITLAGLIGLSPLEAQKRSKVVEMRQKVISTLETLKRFKVLSDYNFDFIPCLFGNFKCKFIDNLYIERR